MSGKRSIVDISKLFLFPLDSNDVSATNVFKKITVTGDESNNSGGWGLSPNAAAIFQFFFKK